MANMLIALGYSVEAFLKAMMRAHLSASKKCVAAVGRRGRRETSYSFILFLPPVQEYIYIERERERGSSSSLIVILGSL
jgi:hypothetical protein